jgi:CheY-like chemotaxis protein
MDGQDAVEKVSRNRPDLIVLDMSLPRLDGEAVGKEVRRLHGNIPILLVTADGRAREKAQRVGAFEYLQKPFDIDDLLEIVRRAIPSEGSA